MRVRIMMPTTGSATASRKRTATRTTARSPPRRTVGASGGVMLSPQARRRAATCLRYFASISSGSPRPASLPSCSHQTSSASRRMSSSSCDTTSVVAPARRMRSSATAARSRATRSWWPKVRSISRTGAGARFSASSGPSQRTSPEAWMEPDVGVSSPAASRNRRLLPEPFSPMMPTTVPFGATTSRFSSGALVTLRNARDINVRITTATMEDPKVLERMRADWNERASEDAYYYVAFGRREQDDEEFFSTASDIVKGLEWDLKRVRGKDAALEIGCGPGRLMRPLGRNFGEIHGVDVSDEMIRLAEERLRDTPNAHPVSYTHLT